MIVLSDYSDQPSQGDPTAPVEPITEIHYNCQHGHIYQGPADKSRQGGADSGTVGCLSPLGQLSQLSFKKISISVFCLKAREILVNCFVIDILPEGNIPVRRADVNVKSC